MLKSFLLGISLVCLSAPSTMPSRPVAPAAPASVDTVRAGFVKDRPEPLNMAKDGIRVESYRFSRTVRGGANPFKSGDGPTIVFDVSSDGTVAKDFGIAVALFDASGRLVGAGTGHHKGKLESGKREEVKVEFQDVNQEVHHAATVFMTIETER